MTELSYFRSPAQLFAELGIAEPSQIEPASLKPTQDPQKRDRAQPARPYSTISATPDGTSTGAISDYFDFSVYVDAPVEEIRTWYVQRFLRLRETAFADPKSYFHRYAALSDDEAVATARRIWEQINEPNLVENVLPTRDRATLVLSKGADHAVTGIRLRKI